MLVDRGITQRMAFGNGVCDVREPLGVLPLTWNAGKSAYEIKQGQFEKSTDAGVSFTWYFLRAYGQLAEDLRRAHSTLAVGAAALVAAQAVYPQSFACLPVELQDAAAIVAVLELESPGLLVSCFQGGAPLPQIEQAISKMCAVDGKDAAPDAAAQAKPPGAAARKTGTRLVSKPLHREFAALAKKPINQAFEEGPIQIAAFLPPHPESIQALLTLVESRDGLRHLPLRARIVAASAPERFGLPEFTAQAGAAWRKELDALVAAAREELKLRTDSFGEPVLLAPAYQAGQPRLTLADPGLLRPLLMLAAGAAAPELKAARERGPEAYLDKLRKAEPTRVVLELAGSDPFVELPPRAPEEKKSGPAQEANPAPPPQPASLGSGSNTGAELTWENLVRSKPAADRAPPAESLKVRLIDYVPLGQAKPICGIGTKTFVTMRDEKGKEQRILAEAVQPGMKVLGFRQVGSAESAPEVPLDGTQRQVWFTVMERQLHPKVPRSLALGFRDGTAPIEEIVFSLAHRVFITLSPEEAAWRRTIDVDPTSRPWPIQGAAKNKLMGAVDVEWLRNQYQEQDLIEFSLSSEEERGVANNVLVSSRPSGGVSILAEARPLDAGYIDVTDTITLSDGKTQLPLAELVANPEVKPNPRASIVGGYHLKPTSDTWPYSEITRHEGYLLKKTLARPPYVIELTFEDRSSVRLGPNNWLLTWDGHHARAVRAEKIQEGTAVIAGLDAEEKPRQLKVTKIEKREKPDRDFALIELTNLPYAQIGGVLVSVDYRPWHRTNIGLITTAEVAVPADAAVPVTIAAKGLAADNPALLKEPVVNFDFALDTLTHGHIAEGVVGGVTHMLEIRAQKGAETRTLVCGAGQFFPVSTGADRVEYKQARNFHPGASLFVVDPATGKADRWNVQCVTPRFHALRRLVELAAGKRQQWHGKQVAETDVCFGTNIAFLLKTPGTRRASRSRAEIPGQEGMGEGSGGNNGPYTGGRNSFDERANGYLPEPPPADRIAIPDDAIDQLRARGKDLLARFASEGRGVRPPGANNAALTPWLAALPQPERPWPLADEHVGPALATWLGDVVKRRNGFLNSRDPQLLPGLLFSEAFLATWLHEAGAEATAAGLLQDLVELSIFAGCETGANKDQQRLSGDLQLPLMLSLPAHIARKDKANPSKEDIRQALATYAQTAAKEWARSRGLSTEIVSNKDISLRDLYAYWSQRAPNQFDPFWSFIGQPGSPAGESFKAWLRTRGGHLVLPSRAAETAKPLPPVEVEEKSLLREL